MKIREIYNGSTFYSVRDIYNVLEENKIVTPIQAAKYSWDVTKKLVRTLSAAYTGDRISNLDQKFLLIGFDDYFINWSSAETFIFRKIFDRNTDENRLVKKLNAEIDFNEGILNEAFYKEYFYQITEIPCK